MKREPIVSANVISMGYDPTKTTLEVEYRNGAVYQFFQVQEWDVEGLKDFILENPDANLEIPSSFRYVRVS